MERRSTRPSRLNPRPSARHTRPERLEEWRSTSKRVENASSTGREAMFVTERNERKTFGVAIAPMAPPPPSGCLVLLCGHPASGKSTVAAEISRRVQAAGARVLLVDEPSLHLPRNASYRDARSEKNTRGLLKATVERAVHRDGPVVLLDANNGIKGYRYELWCIARQAGTRFCVVHCETPVDACRKRNSARRDRGGDVGGAGETATRKTRNASSESPRVSAASSSTSTNDFHEEWGGYDAAVFDDLVFRFERPDGKNRWDAPLFVLKPTPEELGADDERGKRRRGRRSARGGGWVSAAREPRRVRLGARLFGTRVGTRGVFCARRARSASRELFGAKRRRRRGESFAARRETRERSPSRRRAIGVDAADASADGRQSPRGRRRRGAGYHRLHSEARRGVGRCRRVSVRRSGAVRVWFASTESRRFTMRARAPSLQVLRRLKRSFLRSAAAAAAGAASPRDAARRLFVEHVQRDADLGAW